jgi:hypothetical protein
MIEIIVIDLLKQWKIHNIIGKSIAVLIKGDKKSPTSPVSLDVPGLPSCLRAGRARLGSSGALE